jgi:hypothetical protein
LRKKEELDGFQSGGCGGGGAADDRERVGANAPRAANSVGRSGPGRIEDISPAEVAAILKKRHDDRPLVQANAAGRIGPIEWQNQVDLTKGSRLWFVTSPPDGKVPPVTVEARARAAAPGGTARTRFRGLVA